MKTLQDFINESIQQVNESYNSYDICREILDHYDIEESDENWIGTVDIDDYLDLYYPKMKDNDRWFVHDRMEKFVNVSKYESIRDEENDD
jgi:phage pi2 protein 07